MGAEANVSVNPVTMNMNVNGLNDIGAEVDLGLDDINLHLDKVEADVKAGLHLDKVEADVKAGLHLDKVEADVKAGLHLDEIKADLKAALTLGEIKAALQTDMRADLQASLKELAPIIFSFLWKEIPLVRVSTPHRYRLGLQVFGREWFALTFCGESELISDKNQCGAKLGGDHG